MHVSGITKEERELKNDHKAFVVWLTGISGAGKSTIAGTMARSLFDRNIHVKVLDGDEIRAGINRDLDFSATGRSENIRRVAEISRLFCNAGMVVIVALISPYEADRQRAKTIIGANNFVEVFVDASVECCRTRDVKGLYEKADAGKINNFTAVSDVYERPTNPDLHLNTENTTAAGSVVQLMSLLVERKYL